jgi:hypothetical protein
VHNDSRRTLRAKLKEIINEQTEGVECLDVIATEFRLAIEDNKRQFTTAKADSEVAAKSQDTPTQSRKEQGTRRVLWMHHLLATSKRQFIVQRSRELSIAGFSKPGYPGALYLEGSVTAVESFLRELKVTCTSST